MRPQQPLIATRGLWSLWDMLRVNGVAFYKAMTFLSSMRMVTLVNGPDHTSDYPLNHTESPADVDLSVDYIREASALRAELEKFGAKFTLSTVVRFLESAEAGDCTFAMANKFIGEIDSRLRDELIATPLLVLKPERASFYEPQSPLFGDGVATKFPSADFEIDEAAKCLAVARYTAAVFHLMRVLEIGIKAASKCLGIPDPTRDAERNWGVMLRKIRDEIMRRDKTAPPQWASMADKQFLEETYASLDAVRNVWRNATMHVETKYTEEEADHIFMAVRGFMRKLASRCDEAGQPRA